MKPASTQIKTLFHNRLLATEGITADTVGREAANFTQPADALFWFQEEFSDFRIEYPASGSERVYGTFSCEVRWFPGAGIADADTLCDRISDMFNPLDGEFGDSSCAIQPYSIRRINTANDGVRFFTGVRISFFAYCR